MITNLETRISESIELPASSSDAVLLCATDDAYVMPLAAMLYSAGENLRVGSRLLVMILDGGVSEENKQKLRESLVDLPIDLNWISFNAEILNRFEVSHHVSHTAYYRLLLSEVLPEQLDKVLYLDCDLLIQGDLMELWEQDLGESTLMAVPDVACPYVDATRGMKNFKRANPYLAAFRPIRNYQELGIDESSLYFNSGVMLIDVQKWRRDQVTNKLLQCMSSNQSFIWCWDQYALNVVLHGKWKPLDMRWNLGSHAFDYPGERYSPVESGEFTQMLSDPKVIHFTTEWKPWHYGIRHPYREQFFETLDRTVWKGWRPDRPPFSWRKLVEKMMVGAIKKGTIAYRKITSVW